jgi:hypothetical protein
VVARKRLSPDETLAACIRPERPAPRLSPGSSLCVVLLRLSPCCGWDTNVIHTVGVAPDITLHTCIRTVRHSGGVDALGSVRVILLCLRSNRRNHADVIIRKCLTPYKTLPAGIRPEGASTGLPTCRGLGIVLLRLRSSCRRHANVIAGTCFAPDISLKATTSNGAANRDAGRTRRHRANRNRNTVGVQGLHWIAASTVRPDEISQINIARGRGRPSSLRGSLQCCCQTRHRIRPWFGTPPCNSERDRPGRTGCVPA